MINGATQIIGGVSGQNLDPLLLAKSQTRDSTGFIMITYHISADEVQPNADSISSGKKFYDLLFFKGSAVYECARLNQDLRFVVNGETALKTFEAHRNDSLTLVYLFQAPEEVILRFRSTFYYEPCLKVQIGYLSKKQIITLLKSSRCRRGIVECNEFTGSAPAIHLTEIRSEEELSAFNPTLRQGRLLLYDVDKNREIIHERYSRPPSNLAANVNAKVYCPPALSEPITPLFRVGNGNDSSSTKPELPVLSKAQADEFTQFIQQILNSPLTAGEPHPEGVDECQMEERKQVRPDIVVRVQEELPLFPAKEKASLREPLVRDPCIRAKLSAEPGGRKDPREIRKKTKHRSTPSAGRLTSTLDESAKYSGKLPSEQSEYVRTFERLFRSFRQQVFEHFGQKCEDVIAQAEKKVRFLSPEFDCHALTDETASSILEVVEEIVKEASFIKRSKLRQAAITLISDLYNKQYNLLEQHRAIDRVEEIYYRLKK